MEKMFILIAFLFPAFAPEYTRNADSHHQAFFLSTTSCSITSLSLDNVGECDDNGTADPFDDFFTVDILVEFVDPPTTGQLRVELGEDAMPGGGPMSIDVFDIADPGSHTFEGIRVEANGNPTEIPVSFSAEPFCREVLSNGPAVANCSGLLPCEITSVVIDNVSVCQNNGTGDPSDDFFTARVSITFFNPPATGDLRIEPGGDALPGGGATSIPVSGLSNEFGHSFTGVRFKADGTVTVVEVEFTADNACTGTGTGPTVPSCSGSPCTITVDFFGNPSACDDNGTPNDLTDDFFTQNVHASFFNRPTTGNLQIVPGGDAIGVYSIAVNQIVGNAHTFNAVKLKADGTPTVVQMNFTDNTACIDEDTGPTVQPCSVPPPPCIMIVNFLGNPSPCDNNGTPNDPTDDFFTQNIHASFFNRPFTGSLQIVPGGDAIGVYSIAANQIVGNSHIFNNVKLKANGTPTVIQMNFTDNPACIDEEAGPAVEGDCCDLVITNVVATPESCPNADDGNITVTATTSAGPLSYVISGPVNQSNNSGVFTGLPNGNYGITVTDTGAPGCSETTSAFVPAGMDLVPPTPVCRNTTVALDATGNYTLTTDDVLNLSASSDNCGTVSITGKFPETVSCVQVGQTIPVNVTVADGNGNLATCTAQITVQEGTALPTGFSGSNVGNANGTNAFQPCSGQKFTLTASGFSTSSADVLRLVSRQLCGSGEIIARVVSVNGGGWAGITLRETTAPGSKKVALKTQFSNNIRREIRTMTNGAVNNLNFSRPQDTWLRLVRNGPNFSGYTSMDGVNWNFAFSTTISMAGCIHVGVFSESINANVVTTAVFDQVVISGAAVPLTAPGTGSVVAFEAPDFQAYPNPTTGELTLDLHAFADRSVRLEISNVHGQTLNVLNLNPAAGHTERLDLSQFQAGIYLIAAKSEGWPAVVKRVVLMERR
ncbi:MAG: T9SS type A sorting domain-containing protein [Saprospiraceae bacterium]